MATNPYMVQPMQGMPYYGVQPGQMGPGTPNPQMPQQQAQMGYGYGQGPGQSSRGYYEQQTPAGSFAAADRAQLGPTAMADNPYIGQRSTNASAASNPYAGQGNPYTRAAIDAASSDAIRNYNNFVAPARDTQMARSGSFGNTGIQQMQLEDQRNLQGTLGNIANNAWMADLSRQQDMGERAADRQTGVSQFNSTLGANDIGRNASLAQGMGQFNAGAMNQANLYGAGLEQQTNLANAGAGNHMLDRYVSNNQFDQQMDFGVDNANWNRMRTGQQDAINWINQLMGYGQGGINNATNVQNAPLNYQQMFAQMGQGLGGMGGVNSQNMQGNPYLGFLGGLGLGGQIYNNWSG